MGWRSNGHMASLERGWLADYAINTPHIMELLAKVKQKKKGKDKAIYKEAGLKLWEAYIQHWDFLLPGDTDEEWEHRCFNGTKNPSREKQVRVEDETEAEKDARISARLEVRSTKFPVDESLIALRNSTSELGSRRGTLATT